MNDTPLVEAATLSSYQAMYLALRRIQSIAGNSMCAKDRARLEQIEQIASQACDSVPPPKEAKV